MKALIAGLAGLFIGGTLAVAAYIELSARRGVAAGPTWQEPETDDWATDAGLIYPPVSRCGNCLREYYSNGWVRCPACDSPLTTLVPRTAELATGGGR